MRWVSGYLLCLLLCLPGRGGEVVHLTNGFDIKALSHKRNGESWILQTSTGSMELPVSEVSAIEATTTSDKETSAAASQSYEVSAEEALQTAAHMQGLPPAFIRSVAHAESGYNVAALSPKGAIGLMQLMPSTAARLGVRPEVVSENAKGGAEYLRELLVCYHGNAALALAAYNAGPGAVSKYGGIPPYAETRLYVAKVLKEYMRQQKVPAANHSSNKNCAH